MDRKSKGSPTCYCADCLREKNKKSVVTVTNNSVELGLVKQRMMGGGIKCDGGGGGSDGNHIELTSLIRADNNQNSLSPCQSCVNAQVSTLLIDMVF